MTNVLKKMRGGGATPPRTCMREILLSWLGSCISIALIALLERHVTRSTGFPREQIRQKEISDAGRHLTHAFEFLARVFGEGQEMVIFLSELSAGYYSLKFVSECGNDAYYKYNKLLLLKERTQELKDEAMELLGL